VDIIKKAHSAGFMNLDIPESCGGLDMDLVSNVIVSESMDMAVLELELY